MNQNNENLNYNYPKLRNLEEFFGTELKDKDLSNTVIIACQHLLGPQKIMFEALLSLGFLPENIFLLGKVYSTSNEVLNEIKNLGIYVVQPEFNPLVSFDAQHADNCRNLIESARKKLLTAEKVIVLDDGAMLLQEVAKTGLTNVVGVEQTSSGFRKLENSVMSFSVYNVARSKIKLELETPYIINLAVKRIEEELVKMDVKTPNILIVGLGPIGVELQKQLEQKGYSITTYDEIHGKQNLSDLIQKDIQVVIGTTGSQILSHNELVMLNDLLEEKIILISLSSSDREFELWKLRDLFHQGKTIHENTSFGNIIIANNGFPITFKGNYFESSPVEMERTMCLLFSGVCLGATSQDFENGIIDIPDVITGKLV